MPKQVKRSHYEERIKELLGLPSYVHILQLRAYTKEYYSQKFGWRFYNYFLVNYYNPLDRKIYRRHIREKDKERKNQILQLWRLEQKLRRGEELTKHDEVLSMWLLS